MFSVVLFRTRRTFAAELTAPERYAPAPRRASGEGVFCLHRNHIFCPTGAILRIANGQPKQRKEAGLLYLAHSLSVFPFRARVRSFLSWLRYRRLLYPFRLARRQTQIYLCEWQATVVQEQASTSLPHLIEGMAHYCIIAAWALYIHL